MIKIILKSFLLDIINWTKNLHPLVVASLVLSVLLYNLDAVTVKNAVILVPLTVYFIVKLIEQD